MSNSNPLSYTNFLAAILILLSFQSIEAAFPIVTWEQLQEEGAVIAGIRIEVQTVFPEEELESRYWFARIANAIHIETKGRVVERELLFKIGDKVNAAIIHDSERSLRNILDIARDVVIVPERVEGNEVWVLVIFKDAWSLAANANFGHVGGQNNYKFMIRERNLLGLGKGLLISHQQTSERSIDELDYYDPQLFGSHWTLNTNYMKLSDGETRFFQLDRPFRTFQAPWAFQLKASNNDETLTLYTAAHPVYAMRYQKQSVNLTTAWAYRTTPDEAYRLGVGFAVQQKKYSDLVTYPSDHLPVPKLEERRLQGPGLTWQWFQDRYKNYRNLNDIGRTEQYNLGWDVNASVGYYSRSLGSTTDGSFFSASATKGWRIGDDSLILARGWANGRRENGLWRNVFLTNEVTFFNRSFPRQTLAGYLRLDLGLRPDLENWLYIGGEEGLRGYTNHFLPGDKRCILNLEDRVITDRTLWGLLQVGYVGFLDVGAIHTFDTDGYGKIFADVGGGLRFGNIRSRAGSVVELTIAFPLVKGPGSSAYEIVVGNVLRF